MICGNTQAEIERDTQTDAQEQAQYAAEHARWKLYVEQLLAGVTIEENGRKYSLDERVRNEFNFIDPELDFMADLAAGKCHPVLKRLIQSEARTLASIIAG